VQTLRRPQFFGRDQDDLFVSGLSPLHQAIINEDAQMVGFLLQRGADIHQRCYGAFFCPEDQKASRTDSLEHEWVDLRLKTNYTGYRTRFFVSKSNP
jgi:ankyrin repeat protein